jgi:hypothetical protein
MKSMPSRTTSTRSNPVLSAKLPLDVYLRYLELVGVASKVAFGDGTAGLQGVESYPATITFTAAPSTPETASHEAAPVTTDKRLTLNETLTLTFDGVYKDAACLGLVSRQVLQEVSSLAGNAAKRSGTGHAIAEVIEDAAAKFCHSETSLLTAMTDERNTKDSFLSAHGKAPHERRRWCHQLAFATRTVDSVIVNKPNAKYAAAAQCAEVVFELAGKPCGRPLIVPIFVRNDGTEDTVAREDYIVAQRIRALSVQRQLAYEALLIGPSVPLELAELIVRSM